MRALAERIWQWPGWPPRLRRTLEPLLMFDPLQYVLIPHFRCGVSGIIQNDRGEILLLRHTYRNTYPWGLPGGFMQHGEQPDAALRRELSEEIGLAVALSPVWYVYVDERQIVNVIFRGQSAGGECRPSAEISEARFFPPHALPALLPDQEALLRRHAEEGVS